MGLFAWLRDRRREKLAALHPVDDEAWDWAVRHHRVLDGLAPEELERLRSLSAAFLAEKRFIEARGAVADSEARLSIAVQACLPLLELGLRWYDDWETIILVPKEFNYTRRDVDSAGIVTERDDELAGQVLELGPVVLSLRDVEASGWGDGFNVVIHEFAHKLDERDGELDGCPPLHRGVSATAWRAAFLAAWTDFSERAKKPAPWGKRKRGKGALPLDSYAAESPDEFFAVACEYFFERPFRLRDAYPDVYAVMQDFFRQDPAERLARAGLTGRA